MNKEKRQKMQWQLMRLVGNKHYNRSRNKVKHHGDELVHYLCKAVAGHLCEGEFLTEVEFPNGRIADFVDLDKMQVLEFETNFTEKGRREKESNFESYGCVERVFVLDISEVDSLEGMKHYVGEYV